jgi:Xaa-Pro aminopeptidase
MNRSELKEGQIKTTRVLDFLEKNGYDALLIGRKDNFAWFTSGGSNEVVRSTEGGFAILLITRTETRMIAHVMDGQRILDEELNGWDVEYVPLRWYDGSLLDKAAQLIKGMKVLSDVDCRGAVCDQKAVQSMHFPLTDGEVQKLRKLGAITDEILRSAANEIQPGMTELEIAGMLIGEYKRLGLGCDVLLIGSDERVSKYRHPVPTGKKVQTHVLLHPAIYGWGLHANVTRQVYFDGVPQDIEKKYEAACVIQAASIAMCVPGRKFTEILETQKRLYGEFGYAEEWRNHFQGAITGYMLADPTMSLDPDARIASHQAYDWFVTITGVKCEELSLNTGNSREVCSAAGHWPTKRYSFDSQTFELPQILIR